MTKDNRLIYESFANTQYDKLAITLSKLHVAHDALKACYSHFTSEPNDPGHPTLIRVVERALEELK